MVVFMVRSERKRSPERAPETRASTVTRRASGSELFQRFLRHVRTHERSTATFATTRQQGGDSVLTGALAEPLRCHAAANGTRLLPAWIVRLHDDSQVVQRQVVLYLAGWGIVGVEERVPVGVSSIWLGGVSWRVEEGGLPVAVDKDLTELRFSHNSASTLAHNSHTPPGGNHELRDTSVWRRQLSDKGLPYCPHCPLHNSP